MNQELPTVAPPRLEVLDQIRLAIHAALEKKAEMIQVLEIGKVSSFADYFIIMSANSDRHVKTLGDAVEDALVAHRVKPHHTEGYDTLRWVLLDYGAFLVHIFHHASREFYKLEKLWVDAPELDLKELLGGAGHPLQAAGKEG